MGPHEAKKGINNFQIGIGSKKYMIVLIKLIDFKLLKARHDKYEILYTIKSKMSVTNILLSC